MPGERTMRLTEPEQMRALTHPLRLELLGLLRADGPATATVLADRTGVSTPLASYHLRRLATHGFIEEAPELARDGRERVWRARHERTSWSTTEWLDTPERAAAEAAFGRTIVRRHLRAVEAWMDAAASWPRRWVDATEMSDWLLELTPAEMRELREELKATVERYAARAPKRGAERVLAIVQVFPWVEDRT
ncbi:MAG TPA: winged helix-turn-helix domain-containing protein [Actinomycetota bacterium]|jgi:DNA-binding transcriptional ArsR family regulator